MGGKSRKHVNQDKYLGAALETELADDKAREKDKRMNVMMRLLLYRAHRKPKTTRT